MSSVATEAIHPLEGVTQSSYLPWVVCFSGALFFLFEFMQVNMFNAITPSLMKEFSLSAAKVGHISANYFYATLIFLLPAGVILDRSSTRKVILVAMGSSVICAFIFASSHSVWVAELCRFVTGIGGSFCLISCIRLATSWFPPKRLALVIGLIVTLAMFGGVLAQTPMTLLTDTVGWRKMLLLDASLGACMFLVIFWFVQDAPSGNYSFKASERLFIRDFINLLGKSLLNAQNWLAGLYTSLLNLPILLMGAMWGSLYLVQIHGLTRTESSLVTSMIFFGTIIGSPAIGWTSDQLRKRRLPMTICAALSLVAILAVMFVPHLTLLQLIILFFAIGFFTSSQILSYPLIAEGNPKSLIGTSEGLASTLIMAGGTLQPYFGNLLTLHWNHYYVNNLPWYSKNDFLIAMSIIPVALAIGFIATLFIRETNCNPVD